MPGVKGRSGRKPKRVTEFNQWFEQNQVKVIELLDVLYKMGKNGDRDAAQYVLDRVLGKPRISVDSRIKQEIELTADNILEVRQLADRENKAFIENTLQIEAKDA